MANQQLLDLRHNQAREAVQQGRFADALQDYLFLFDYGASGGVSSGVFALIDLDDVIDQMPGAREAFTQRREARQQAVLSNLGDVTELHEIVALNKLLDDANNNILFLDVLTQAGSDLNELRRRFLEMAWKDIAAQGRYDVLAESMPVIAREVVSSIARAHTTAFVSADDDGFASYELPSAVLAYEVLLALGDVATAEKVKRWVLKGVDISPEAPELFANAERKSASQLNAAPTVNPSDSN